MPINKSWRNIVDSVFGGGDTDKDADVGDKDADVGDQVAYMRAVEYTFTRNPTGFPEDDPGIALEILAAQTFYYQQRGYVNRSFFLDVETSVNNCQNWLRQNYKNTGERNALVEGLTLEVWEAQQNPTVFEDKGLFLSKAEIKRQQAPMDTSINIGAFYEDYIQGLYAGSRPRRVLREDYSNFVEYTRSLGRFLVYSRQAEGLVGAVLSAGLVVGAGFSFQMAGAMGSFGSYAIYQASRSAAGIVQAEPSAAEIAAKLFTWGFNLYSSNSTRNAWNAYNAIYEMLKGDGYAPPFTRDLIRDRMTRYVAVDGFDKLKRYVGSLSDPLIAMFKDHNDQLGKPEAWRLFELIMYISANPKPVAKLSAGFVTLCILLWDLPIRYPRARVQNFLSLNDQGEAGKWTRDLLKRISNLKGVHRPPRPPNNPYQLTEDERDRRCIILTKKVTEVFVERKSGNKQHPLRQQIYDINTYIRKMRMLEWRYRRLAWINGQGIVRPRNPVGDNGDDDDDDERPHNPVDGDGDDDDDDDDDDDGDDDGDGDDDDDGEEGGGKKKKRKGNGPEYGTDEYKWPADFDKDEDKRKDYEDSDEKFYNEVNEVDKAKADYYAHWNMPGKHEDESEDDWQARVDAWMRPPNNEEGEPVNPKPNKRRPNKSPARRKPIAVDASANGYGGSVVDEIFALLKM